jgi:hypothetical protein
MKYSAAAALTLVFFAAGVLRAQDASKADANDPSAAKCVSLERSAAGENVLLVDYPWRKHEKPSIEVRLITEKSAYAARAKPQRLAEMPIDEKMQRRIYTAFDTAIDRPSTGKFEIGGMKWDIYARSNHLGQGALWFVNTPEAKDDKSGAAAVFFPPDPWAVNDRVLLLDLPRETFYKPGKLHVWFLRCDRIVWQEEIDWPGQKMGNAKEE